MRWKPWFEVEDEIVRIFSVMIVRLAGMLRSGAIMGARVTIGGEAGGLANAAL